MLYTIAGKQKACQAELLSLCCSAKVSAASAVKNTVVAKVNVTWSSMQAIGRVVAIGLGTAFAIVQASL